MLTRIYASMDVQTKIQPSGSRCGSAASRLGWKSDQRFDSNGIIFNWLTGAAREIRTPDPIITNDVLYQLSYCGPLTNVARGAS